MKDWITDAVTAPAPLDVEAHHRSLREHPELPTACAAPLQHFVSTTSGVTAAVVASSDGFDIAAILHGTVAPEKMAAMTSSMLALGEAILGEADLSNCRNVIIESSDGLIVMLAIGDARRELLLSVITTGDATIGQVLWAAKRCCENIRSAVALIDA